MKLITRAFLLNCIGIVLVDSECILERNQYNEYPWMIKIYWERTWGHGSLTAPNRVLSAYGPFKPSTSNLPTLYLFLDFIASKRGADGKVDCRATRKAKALFRQPQTEREIVFWELTESFDIGHNYPFLISSSAEMHTNHILKNLKDTRFESCYVPLFNEEKTDSTEFTVDEVKRTNWNKCKTKFPSSTRITDEEFCLLQPYLISARPSWRQGAVILCRNKPLGIITETGFEPPDARGLTVFVTLAFSAAVLRQQAKLWPMTPAATTATVGNNTTVRTSTTKKTKTTEGLVTNVVITSLAPETNPTQNSGPSTGVASKETTRKSTKMTSKIPRAPMMTHPPSTTEFTGMFPWTPPIRAKYATRRRRRSSMPPRIGSRSLIGFALCTIVLQRLYTKYTLHA